MSDFFNLINADRRGQKLISDSRQAGALFKDATWDQVGNDKALTDFLHNSLDPSGSKYGRDTEALKTDLLNTQTARGSSAISSVWGAAGARTENSQQKQFENLVGRLYESAPNRLTQGTPGEAYEAIKAGLVGAVVYDAPLNVLFGAGTLGKLSKGALGMSDTALTQLGKDKLQDIAGQAALSEAGTVASREALLAAEKQFAQIPADLAWATAKKDAAGEALGGGAMGFIGDVAQQDAAVQRELQDEVYQTGTALNIAGGAALGGLFGGAGGYFRGRSAGKDLTSTASLPVEIAKNRQANALKLEAESAGSAPPPGGTMEVALADAYRESSSNLGTVADIVDQFANNVTAGYAKSRYTPDQLDAIRGALVDARGAAAKSESLVEQARALRQPPAGATTATPEAISKALELEQQATSYESLIKYLAGVDLTDPRTILPRSDIDERIVRGLAGFYPDLAAALGKKADDAAGGGTPGSAAGSSGGATPKKPAPTGGSMTTGDGVNITVGADGTLMTKTDEVAATPPKAAPEDLRAEDFRKMSETVFTADEKSVFTNLNEELQKAGLDLQAALDALKKLGPEQTAADIAAKSGGSRESVESMLKTVDDAGKREQAKTQAEAPPKQEPTEQVDQAAGSQDEPVVTEESILAAEQMQEETIAQVAVMDYNNSVSLMAKYEKAVGDVLDQLGEVLDEAGAAKLKANDGNVKEGKLTKAEKQELATKTLEDLKKANPDIADIISRLSPESVTSKQAITKAKALVKSMMQDALSMSYIRTISDVMPDILNVQHFDSIINSMLRGVPSDDVKRISDHFTKMVYDAIVERINAIGIANVQKDPQLKAAWQRIMEGSGGYQQFGGKNSASIDVGELVNKYADQVARSAPMKLKDLEKAGGAVRDFMKQLQAAGLPMDSDMMRRALEMKALHAVNDLINDTFAKENAEGFEKLAKMRELRERDRNQGLMSRSVAQERNPFFGSMVGNPILHRMENSQGVMQDFVVSGSKQPRGDGGVRGVGGPQGILSDGISDYLGTIWAHPRKMFAAAGAARRAIYGAAVEAASWARGKISIDGVEFKGSMKEMKGRYAEQVQARREQARFGLIMDAIERRNMMDDNPRYLSETKFGDQIKLISGIERPVTPDELYVATMLYENKQRMANTADTVRQKISEILDESGELGLSESALIAELVTKHSQFLQKNATNMVSATQDALDRIAGVTSSRQKKVQQVSQEKGGKPTSRVEGMVQGKALETGEERRTFKTAMINQDGSLLPSTRDVDEILIFENKKTGASHEFVVSGVISMNNKSDIMLFGQKIGTWRQEPGKGFGAFVKIPGYIDQGEFIPDLTSLVSRKSFLKKFQEQFDSVATVKAANASNKANAESATLPSIPKELSETAANEKAKAQILTPAKVTEEDLAKKLDSFIVPEGHVIVIKDDTTSRILRPGKDQRGLTVQQFLDVVKNKSDSLTIGSIPAGVTKAGKLKGLTTQESMLPAFVPLGRDVGPADPDLLKAIADKQEKVTPMAEAQKGPISFKKAESIVVSEGRTLADLVDEFDLATAGFQWASIPDIKTLDAAIEALTNQARAIETLAPHGVIRNNASRRQSFYWLQEHMAAYTPEEKMRALDTLRRMEAAGDGSMPYFYKSPEEKSNSFGIGNGKDRGSSGIFLGAERDALPGHVVVQHELGHWAYTNMLSPMEKVEFFMALRKYYPQDGSSISPDAIMDAMPNAKALEQATGRKFKGATTSVNELFAWHYTNHALNVTNGGVVDAAEQSLWSKVASKLKNLLSYFIGGKIDPDMAKLFEKILPTNLSEKRFDYSVIYDRTTGKPVDMKTLAANRKEAVGLVDMMSQIDDMRGKLGVHILTPGGAADAGFIEDLKAANTHMYLLLMGKTRTVANDGLRKALNPFRPVSESQAKAMGLKDNWLRNKDGKVLAEAGTKLPDGTTLPEGMTLKDARAKYPNAKIEAAKVYAVDPAFIDVRTLYSRKGVGQLQQAIRDFIPDEKVAENVAFEAAKSGEEFMAHIKNTSIFDNPEVAFVFNRAIEQELKRKISSGASEEVALDAAEMFAYKEAAAYAKDQFNLDIDTNLFENGAIMKLGNEDQIAAIGSVARKLYDLMGDALDHLESRASTSKIGVERNKRVLQTPQRTVEDAAKDEVVVKEVKKNTRKRTPKQTAQSPAAEARVVKEEGERVDGNPDGVPAGASPLVRALIDKVTHRDDETADVMQLALYRLFAAVKGEEDLLDITNADVARITGVALEDGVYPTAPAAVTTAAFDSLRKTLRSISAGLTSEGKSATESMESMIRLLANAKAEEVSGALGFTVTPDGIAKAAMGYLKKGTISKDGMEEFIQDFVSDIGQIMAGLGKTSAASKVTGPAMEAPRELPIVKYGNSGYHPQFIRVSLMNRLRDLPAHVADTLLKRIGATADGSAGQSLGRHIVYKLDGKQGRDAYHVTSESVASESIIGATPRGEKLDGEIALAVQNNDLDRLRYLLNARMAENTAEGLDEFSYARGYVVNMDKVFNMDTAPAQARATVMEKAQAAGVKVNDGRLESSPKLDKVLRDMGYTGFAQGDILHVFNKSNVTDIDDAILTAIRTGRKEGLPDAPLLGDVSLHMTLLPELPVNPTAVEQRALQTGATPGIAKTLSRMLKKKMSMDAGLTEDEMMEVATFSGLQLSDNATRIRNSKGEWLADQIAPKEGTGFFDTITVKMGTALSPMMKTLDKLSGQKWWQKPAIEIRRNMWTDNKAIWQSDVEKKVVMAMRTGDQTGLSVEERAAVAGLKRHFKTLLEQQNEVGVHVADVTDESNEFYLPQRFNVDWIRSNRDEAINMLADWFRKDRGADAGDPVASAKKVINETLNREDLQGILDSSSSTYAQAFGDKLHTRKLRIVGKDWEKMAPMFDNNLRSLLISYTEAATKRIEWSKRFGVKGHGASTYVDIADRGNVAAAEALMRSATGLVTEVGEQAGFEGRTLFTPYARTADEARQVVAGISAYLERTGKEPAIRESIVDAYVKQFEANGGSGADHFRTHISAIVNGLADFGDVGNGVSKHEREFMLKMVGTMGGRPAYTISSNQGVKTAANAMKTFNNVTLLGGSLLSSLPDMTTSLFRSGSAAAWMKGWTGAVRTAMGDEATRAALGRIGVGIEGILSENLTHVNGGLSGRISNSFFQATMLTPWTNANRQVAALVGFESIKSNQMIARREAAAGNTDSWQYRKSMRYLRQLGLAQLVNSDPLDSIAKAVDVDAPNGDKIAEALHKFVSESVFQPNRNDAPLWTQDPIASIFWQFKSYPMMMGRLVKRNFKEAFAFDKAGKYEGDPMGLMYLLTVGAAAGAGTMYVKDVALGRNDDPNGDRRSVRDYKISKIAQEFGFDANMDNETLDLIMGSYANGLLQLGALGFLGDLVFQSAKQVDNGAYGRERIMSQILGPSVGTFSDAIQIIEGGMEALSGEEGDSNGKQRNAVRKIVKRLPGIGQQNPWVETFVDNVAGEAMRDPVQPQQ